MVDTSAQQIPDDELAQVLWDYNNFQQPLKKADAILLLGNFDIRTARYAAEVFLRGYAPLLIISGDRSVSGINLWDRPEAEVMGDEAIKLGVPKDKILLERKATNTGENIQFTKELLDEKSLDPQTFIVIQKPCMLRRTYATFMKQWPGKELIMSAPDISFQDYPNDLLPKKSIISIMVGDTQRLNAYAERGFQIPQEIPDTVWSAFKELVKRGYTEHLVTE